MSWKHDELQDDLARSRIGCGEVVAQKLRLGLWGGSGEIDVWTQKLSRTKPRPTVYELKISRSDFLSDVRSEKHRNYEAWAERCYFAVPSGLVDRREIPDGWGLIVRGPNGWSSRKAPRKTPMEEKMWQPLMMAVLLSMHPGPWQEAPRPSRVNSIMAFMESGRRGILESRAFGDRVAAIARESRGLRQTNDELRNYLVWLAGEAGVDMDAKTVDYRSVSKVAERLRHMAAEVSA